MSRPRTRQELYDRIRETSKDEVIVEDMVRLGFWPAQGAVEKDPADEIRRRAELERRIAALRTEQSRLANVEAMRKELKRQRLEASREKQRETKLRHERARAERAVAFAARKKREILHLGEGVSGGLRKGAPPSLEKLAAHGLPVLVTAEDVARAMHIDVGTLRFFAFARRTSTTTHYVRFQVPKKTGGLRLISAPMPRLKKAQRWILDEILGKVTVTTVAHGFVTDRSILTNALPHVAPAIVVNLDLRDFFPTFGFRRIKGMFEGLGYGEEVATILALLTSEPEVDTVTIDDVRWFVARPGRALPQGSPASPAITNIVCRRMDARLAGIAAAMGFAYTRYADDLTFSARTKPDDGVVGKLLRRVRWVIAQEGFREHDQKTRILRTGRRQEVTGVVVNRKPSVPRDAVRRFRATLFQVDKDGPAGKRWGNRHDEACLASLVGFASYVAMIDPDKGKPLLAEARRVATKHGWRPPAPPAAPAPAPALKDDAPKTKKWWKLF